MEFFPSWLQLDSDWVWWLGGASLLTFVGTLIAIPFLVVKIPADYFSAPNREHAAWQNHHPALRWCFLLGKNLLGAILLLAGVAMLVLPGQGLLTILVGILLINFPGKYRVEKCLITKTPALQAANWLRLKAGHAPILTVSAETHPGKNSDDS